MPVKEEEAPVSPIWYRGWRVLLVHPDTYAELNLCSYGGARDATTPEVTEMAASLAKIQKGAVPGGRRKKAVRK